MADADVGSLVVRIEADLKNFETGINSISERLNGFGDTIKKIGRTIAGAFAVEKVVDFFKSTVEDAGKAQETLTQLNAVLLSTEEKAGVTSEKAIELAESLSGVTKFSKDTVLSAENLLLTFTNIGKDIFPQATTAVLNMATALGEDTKSASIQLGKALQDPVAGVTALQRVGVRLSDSQKELVTSLVKSGDTMGAQKIILKELDTEFGNSAIMQGQTYPGKVAILSNKFEELKISIGDKLIPVLFTMVSWFTDKMPIIQKITGDAFDQISKVVESAVNIFKINLLPIIQNIVTFIQANWPAIKATNESVFNAIISVATTMWNFFKTNLLPIYQELFKYISEHMPEIQATVKDVFDAIVLVANQFWTFFKENLLPILASFYGFIKDHMPQIESIVSGVFTIIKNVVTVAWDIFERLLLPILKALWDFISPTFPLIGAVIKTAFDIVIGIVQGVVDIFEKVTGAIKTAIDWLKSWNGTPAKNKEIHTGIFADQQQPTGPARTGAIPAFATGTNFVPYDMLAQIHKGEAIVPANNNPSNPNANDSMGGNGININIASMSVRNDNDIKMIAREIFNLQQSRSRGSGVIAPA